MYAADLVVSTRWLRLVRAKYVVMDYRCSSTDPARNRGSSSPVVGTN